MSSAKVMAHFPAPILTRGINLKVEYLFYTQAAEERYLYPLPNLKKEKQMKNSMMAIIMGMMMVTPALADVQYGKASYYWQGQGQKTANGERFNPSSMTAAHRRYPFGTMVRVTNMHNNSSVVLRINDRGPFVRGRIIDVSKAAAKHLGMLKAGIVKVKVEKLQ